MNPTLSLHLRRSFFRLSSREKVLVAIFLAALLLIWAGSTLSGLARLARQLDFAGVELKDQRFLLDQQAEVDARLEIALSRLQPDRTFSAAELVGRIDEIARRRAGVAYEIFTPRTEADAEFNLHTLRVRFRKAAIADLLEFNQDLLSEEPYITLDNLRLSSNKSNPAEIEAQFVLTSLELKSGPAQ